MGFIFDGRTLVGVLIGIALLMGYQHWQARKAS